MRRHRINRNFTKPEAIGPIVFSLNSFEQVVKALNTSPEEYERSLELKEWVRYAVTRITNTYPRGCWRRLDFT